MPATPGSAAWAKLHYGPGWPNCPVQDQFITTVFAFGRKMGWNKKAKRGLKRIDRVFRENVPGYYKDICAERDTGSYVCRPIAGTSVPSNHSFGTAADLDWQENARDGDHKSEMRDRGMPAINKLKAEGLVRWGGDYDSPDDMHLEIIMTPAEIRAKYTWTGKLKRRAR